MMDWTGVWRNQYGSTVRIAHADASRIEGVFETALEDSGFYNQAVPIVGVARGDCIAFSSAATGPAGDMVVSYTGLFRDGVLQTVWFYVGDEALTASGSGEPAERKKTPWWKAVITNSDTFRRTG